MILATLRVYWHYNGLTLTWTRAEVDAFDVALTFFFFEDVYLLNNLAELYEWRNYVSSDVGMSSDKGKAQLDTTVTNKKFGTLQILKTVSCQTLP